MGGTAPEQQRRQTWKTWHPDHKISFWDQLAENEIARCALERASANGNGDGERSPRFCSCVELLNADHERLPSPPQHNCAYTLARSRLVPIAFKRAVAEIGEPATGNIRSQQRFTKVFAKKMEELAAPLLTEPEPEPEKPFVADAVPLWMW
jgi:hypothetical protein